MKNKTIRIIIIALIVIVAIEVIYLLLSKKSEVNIEQGEITTTITSAPIFINCGADSDCLSTNFLSCNLLDFEMEFIEPGSKFIISVIGKGNDKCHYLTQVINSDDSILMGYECEVPLTEISLDTVKHFFGQNTGEVEDKQIQLEKDYCVSL